MDLHQRAAARGQTRAAGLGLPALDWHQDRGQTPREQRPRPGTPREDQPLGSVQNHYEHGALPSIAMGLGAAVSSPRTGQLASIVPKERLKDGAWDSTSTVPSGLATFWRPTPR